MTELLNCTGLSKAYGKKRALDHVDLHLEPGKIIGLLGPNGSGHERDRFLPAGRRLAAGLDACGAAGGNVPRFLRRF